jgi:integrase
VFGKSLPKWAFSGMLYRHAPNTEPSQMATRKSVKLPVVFRDPTPPPPDSRIGYRLIRDPDTRRLHLRVTKTGAKSWVLIYGRSFTIGSFSDWPYALAREEAHRLNRLIDQGGDPHADRDTRRESPTIAKLIEEWRRDVFSKNPPRIRPATLKEYEGQISQWIMPQLGGRLVVDIAKTDIEKLHELITRKGKKRGTPNRANRVVALVSTLFNFAIKQEMCADNPAKGVEKNVEQPRYRLLSGDEFDRLLTAIGECRNPQAQKALRLLLLTGSRRSEVLSLEWSQLDLASGIWSKPPGMVKQKRLHIVPLSAPARAILAEIRDEAEARSARTGLPMSRWVFPAAGKRDAPIQEIKITWANVCKRAGIEDLHLHDLRHVFATYFASTGVGLPLIGRLLGHSQARTTERYSHVALDPMREQVERFGAFVTAVEAGKSGEVIEHPRAQRRRG